MNDNNDDSNIIKFPDPDEYHGPEIDPEIIARIEIKTDGTASVWISHAVETDDQIDYVKRMLGDSITAGYNYLNGVDDGLEYSEGVLDDDLDV